MCYAMLLESNRAHLCNLGVNLNPTTCLGVQVAESSNLKHKVCCKLMDSADWVLILQSSYLRELGFS